MTDDRKLMMLLQRMNSHVRRHGAGGGMEMKGQCGKGPGAHCMRNLQGETGVYPPPPYGAPPSPKMPAPPMAIPNFGKGRLLYFLEEEDGISQSDLLQKADVRPSSLSETLSKLESQGLINRKTNALDKRETLIYLTDEGRKLVSGYTQRMDERAKELFSALSEKEKKQLIALLEKLLG